MRLAFRMLLWLLLLTFIAAVALAWFSLSSRPAVDRRAELSHEDIELARQVIRMNDPRDFPAGSEHDVHMTEQEITLALDYLVRRFARGAARVKARDGLLVFRGTFTLPEIPFRPYLNITAMIEAPEGVPRVTSLSLGSVPVPASVAAWAFERVTGFAGLTQEHRLVSRMIRRLEIRPREVSVRYRWEPDSMRALGAKFAGADADALAAYHARLVALQAAGGARQGSITAVLQFMFTLAQQRSAAGDPVAENRALLLILGAWAGDRGLSRLVPEATDRPARYALSLRQRGDFGQHFLVSAGIAAAGETGLANAIGIYKEVADARSASGFSFTDIAADRAGTRFGYLATASSGSARRVQSLLSRGVAEADIMPAVQDLPEGLSEAEFSSRYAGVDSPAYRAVLEEIDRRIGACALYRG